MALNAKKILKSDFAIATTGNAGPEKGDSDKDIGLIYISIATLNEVSRLNLILERTEKNINKSVNKALELLFSELSSEDKKFGITVNVVNLQPVF